MKQMTMVSELAMANLFIRKSTCFNHKRIHKGTWKMPGGEQTNEIDHVLALEDMVHQYWKLIAIPITI
jgi:hypothetical protein